MVVTRLLVIRNPLMTSAAVVSNRRVPGSARRGGIRRPRRPLDVRHHRYPGLEP